MLFHFGISPSVGTAEMIMSIIFAVIIFVVLPIVLAYVEYRATRKRKEYGLYLLLGTFASSLFLGVYSLFIGLILLIVYLAVSFRRDREGK